MEVILLQDASILGLSGGQRKSDLKRAFGIIDKSGTVFVVVASNDADYAVWTREISVAINFFSQLKSGGLNGIENSGERKFQTARATSNTTLSTSISMSSLGSLSEGQISRNGMIDRELSDCHSDDLVKGVRPTGKAKTTSRSLEGFDATSAQSSTGDVLSIDGREKKEETEKSTRLDMAAQGNETAPKILQMRNRLAIVGQATKKGFGSALQATKQKAIEAAEKRRLKVESTNASFPTPDRKPFPLQKVKSIPETNLIEESNQRKTYEEGGVPQSELVVDSKPLFRQIGNGSDDQSVTSDCMEDGEDVESKVGLRQRFGAAVRSAKLSTTNITESKRFGFFKRDGKQERGDENMMGVPEATRIKNIILNGRLELPGSSFWDKSSEFDSIEWKQLQGEWYATVDVTSATRLKEGPIVDVQSGSAEASQMESDLPIVATLDSSNMTEIAPIQSSLIYPTEIQHQNQHELVPTSEDIGDPYSKYSTTNSTELEKVVVYELMPTATGATDDGLDVEVDVELQFRIRIWQQRKENTQVDPIEIVRTLADVLALHTSISEELARLPSRLLCNNEENMRTTLGGMTSNLTSILGLTTLEAVVLTGRLLGGLFRVPLSNKQASFDYHGKCTQFQQQRYIRSLTLLFQGQQLHSS
jgi:hypothetical protein